MKKVLYFHASRNVKNILEKDSLLLEKLTPSQTAIEYFISNVLLSKEIDEFYLVTSDRPADDAFESVVKRFGRENLHTLRIPSSGEYAIEEKNRFINDNFTFRFPYFGLYSAKCCREYMEKHEADFALIMMAEHNILLQADLLEAIISRTLNKGDFFRSGHPAVPIIAAPFKEITSLYLLLQAHIKQQLQHILRTIDDDHEFLQKEFQFALNRDVKKEKAQNFFSRPLRMEDMFIVRDQREGVFSRSLYETISPYRMQFNPLLTKEHLEIIKKAATAHERITLENFFESQVPEPFDDQNNSFPGYVEIELTNRSDIKCENCPQAVLTRKSCDMDEKKYMDILDVFAGRAPMLCLGGYGEPLLHEKAADFVRLAKERGMLNVSLETNGKLLTDSKMKELISAGLDILIINIDPLDAGADEGSEKVIHRALQARGTAEKPYIVIETVNNLRRQKKIDYYFRKWQYFVDRVLLLPFNDYLGAFTEEGVVDFTPPREPASICKKTYASAVILSDGALTFCCQKLNGFDDKSPASLIEKWRSYRTRGLKEDFCKNCRAWYQLDISPVTLPQHFQPEFFENKVYNTLLPEGIRKGQALYDEGDYDRALDEWERVLKYDPSNTFIHQKLDELMEKLEREEQL